MTTKPTTKPIVPPKPSSSKGIWIGVGILILIILAIIGVSVWYFGFYKPAKEEEEEEEGGEPGDGENPPEDEEEEKPKPTGIWLRDPGGGYVSGLNYADSQVYCANHDAKLASKAQLISAGDKGLEACYDGWLADGLHGYFMQSGRPGCGNKGFNTIGNIPQSGKLSTVCYGPIPLTEDVLTYKILE